MIHAAASKANRFWRAHASRKASPKARKHFLTFASPTQLSPAKRWSTPHHSLRHGTASSKQAHPASPRRQQAHPASSQSKIWHSHRSIQQGSPSSVTNVQSMAPQSQHPASKSIQRHHASYRLEAVDGRNNRDSAQSSSTHAIATRHIQAVVDDLGKTLPRNAFQCCREKAKLDGRNNRDFTYSKSAFLRTSAPTTLKR